MARARVIATNMATGVKTATASDPGGFYNLQFLPIGSYRLTAIAPGFKTASVGPLILEIDEIARINFKLQVGSVATTVSVSAEASAPFYNLVGADGYVVLTESEGVENHMAMQDVKNQVHAMFFPSGNTDNLVFYGDKDCGLNEVYQAFKNGDHEGAMSMMDAKLAACKSGKHKDKTLVRAYYDDGLLHCFAHDYNKSSTLFTNAMDGKGAEDVGTASAACSRAREGAAALKEYEARLAQIQPPPPINTQPVTPATPPPPAQTAAGSTTAAPQAPAGQRAGVPSVVTRLKELDDLYKSGLITKQEYDNKKAAILKSL